jgi:hypothetical protein
MDGTDRTGGRCSFGLGATKTGCTGQLGLVEAGENHNGHPLVKGRVCRACNHVVVAVRLYAADVMALGMSGHVVTTKMVQEWVDFCNGRPNEIGEKVEDRRIQVEAAHNAIRGLEKSFVTAWAEMKEEIENEEE